MNTKERDRLKVLHELQQGHFTQGAAAQQLGVTDRWVRKLLVRVKKEGDGGIVHRLRGRASNRRLAESLRAQALKLVKAKYGDFGPTLEHFHLLCGVSGAKKEALAVRDGYGLEGLSRCRKQLFVVPGSVAAQDLFDLAPHGLDGIEVR